MSGTQPAPAASAGAEPDPLLGRVLNDRYRIVEAIGHGGMGRVYKAVQSPLDRVVALKVLGAGHDRDPNFYKRFFLEASVTARLTHPNTITLYDYGRTDDGIFFIAMEFLDGRTLSQAMQTDGPLAQERVIHIAQQICRSLREAHALGIIHRDLKPANVMLLRQQDDHDFVKVLDFGLVKFFSGEGSENEITNAGTFMGSPHYIAPEQARNQGPDQRCDIYSLGILLYHMLTARVPFTAAAPVDIILKHLHDAPVPLRELRDDLAIAPELEQIVLRCMAKSRDDRFQSMDELLAQLKAVRALLVGSSGPQPVAPHHHTQPIKSAPPPAVAQTPPTPQPGTRTPSQPMSSMRATPSRGTPHVSRPPPPPLEAIVEEEEGAWASRRRAVEEWARRQIAAAHRQAQWARRHWMAKRRAANRWVEQNWQVLRIGVAPALILIAGIGTAAYVLRAPSSVVVDAASPTPSPPVAAIVPAPPPPAVVPAPEASPPAVAAAPGAPPPAAVPAPPPAPVVAAAPTAAPPSAPVQPAYPQAYAGTTLVTLTSNPSGAEVRDPDDKFLGTTPFDLRVPSNKPLRLTLRHHGYRPAPVKRVVEGERMSLNVMMKSAKTDPYESRPGRRSVGYKDDPY
jgi:serine/threonine-protein kinase